MARELAKAGFYFAAVPYIKNYLVEGRKVGSGSVDDIIDDITTHVGVRPFEVLSSSILTNPRAPIIRFILAKKHFRTREYASALRNLAYVPNNHSMKPFALMLEGSIHSLQNAHKKAIRAYRKCIDKSNDNLSREKIKARRRQLAINRDNCIVGIPRTQFAASIYEEAHITYLDLPKNSFIWPEILFEEAWNSFYQRNYNRTLGKLVTYKAPILRHVFNPEIEVLRALTYMELCLWEDAKLTVDKFYQKYQKGSKRVDRYISLYGKDYKHFFNLAKDFIRGEKRGRELLEQMLNDITRDGTFLELFDSFRRGLVEYKRTSSIRSKRLRSLLKKDIKSILVLQRNLIGSYVRKRLQIHQSEVFKALKGMSFIKLEVLAKSKKELYNPEAEDRSRGDIRNLKRTSQQYFWGFNGEFWADEIGDHIFSLQSECRE
ncbi:MAG: hypothetical protein OXB84_05145 [Halobacteriovoraceae bacterium]|nr:hypothetical protein [Halobacteriovoraceae bacterium]